MDQGSNKNTAIIGIIAIVIIAAAVIGTIALKSKSKTSDSGTASSTTSSTASDTPATSSTNSTASSTTGSYKDGSYAATGSYTSPGGNEEISIKITLKDGTITDTSATTQSAQAESREYQNDFLGSYKDLVVGKAINSVKLSKVAGSSLTSQGFNEALQKIISQAKA